MELLPKLSSRYFNQITYDAVHQTITKKSKNERKLIDEIQWYLQLPDTLKRYIPKIKDYGLDQGNVYLTMEYLALPVMSAMLMDEGIQLWEWKTVFHSILSVQQAFSEFKGHLPKSSYGHMYVYKTRQRLNQFLGQNEFAKNVRRNGYYMLNGKSVLCPLLIFEKHLQDVIRLIDQSSCQMIHGDFCLSNLFYDASQENLRLIDPRGSFGETGLYGDHRYDLAKIRHSLSGYEHIVSDKFHVRLHSDGLDMEIQLKQVHQHLRDKWDSILEDLLSEVKLIEALLFLSMLPLHRDRPDRQLVMFGLGTQLLYEALED